MTPRNKRILKAIERIPHETYVLHGSKRSSRILMPRKPCGEIKNPRIAKRKCVYGTSLQEVAIFYALIDLPCDKWGWKVTDSGELIVTIASDKDMFLRMTGYVHVLSKKYFKGLTYDVICFSKIPQQPVRVIRVTAAIVEDWLESGYLIFKRASIKL